ncbi:serine/threonine protein kinase [Streptomyces sp. NBC_01351]|uniref:serine/threonine-protein kinase n=1 Tax=Streptomyces sp. NBC_01351 TaxID=2903833 RepID=UPI002E36D12E|nr:serine/threonine-protein kinase [Streptomyces sp. NBC_01351]
MGTVWRAVDELLGRPVAVKELHLDSGTQAMGPLREARVVAQIRHPHVVVVHDAVEHEGIPFIVMELVDGGSLADRLAATGPLEPAEAAGIGVALLGALSAAHDRGVLHRDVKPANVLLEAGTGRAVLTDFGIARLAGATTISESGAFVGSPEYTSPERMQGAEAGPASDLWSLGVLLCTAVTGESPFHRDSIGGVLHAVVFDEIRPPGRLGPLGPVVRGLLERDPERRIGAAEAARLLAGCAAGTGEGGGEGTGRGGSAQVPVPAVGYTPTERATRPAGALPAKSGRRRAALRVGLVAALLVAAVGGTVTATSLLDDGKGAGATAGPAGAPASSARASAPAGSAAGSSAPAASAAASSAGPSRSVRPAPAGYQVVSDVRGFSLAVPTGFRRTTDEQRVFYGSPDGAVRIGIKTTAPAPSGGPLGVMRLADERGAETNPGYRENKVVPTTHDGHPAALWEFTWDGFTRAEGARHTFDLCWEQGGVLYDVWVSAPVGRAGEARGHFDAALDSFVPASGA